jgi:hypothetical protein
MRNLGACLIFFLALVCLAGFGQLEVKKIKDNPTSQVRFGVTENWKPKTSMKYDTIEYDWSDEEPMIQELLIEPVDFERI